jgi:hypothetical protein
VLFIVKLEGNKKFLWRVLIFEKQRKLIIDRFLRMDPGGLNQAHQHPGAEYPRAWEVGQPGTDVSLYSDVTT